MIYLDTEDLLYIAGRVVQDFAVRDAGLLESALARPLATAFGEHAYPGLHLKAAALLHSLARNRGLVDGNKRLALAATIAFLGLNGHTLTMSNDAAYRLVMAVAEGSIDDVEDIAQVLRRGSAVRGLR